MSLKAEKVWQRSSKGLVKGFLCSEQQSSISWAQMQSSLLLRPGFQALPGILGQFSSQMFEVFSRSSNAGNPSLCVWHSSCSLPRSPVSHCSNPNPHSCLHPWSCQGFVLTESMAESLLGTPALDQGLRRQILESRKLHLFLWKAVKLLTLVLGLEYELWSGWCCISPNFHCLTRNLYQPAQLHKVVFKARRKVKTRLCSEINKVKYSCLVWLLYPLPSFPVQHVLYKALPWMVTSFSVLGFF